MNPEQSIDQAAHLLQSGKPAKAAQILKRVIQKVPGHAHAHHLYGLSLFQERQFVLAERSVSKAISLEPHNPVFRNNLGLILIANRQPDKAIQAHTDAITVEPSSPVAYFHRANVYRHKGDFVQAIRDYEQVLKWDPYSVEAMSNLASVLVSLFEYERAEKLLNDALVIQPAFAQAWNNLGLLHQQTGQSDQAQAAFSRAIEYSPEFLEAHVNLATLLMRLNRYAQAIPLFQKVLKLNPSQSFVLGNLAYCQSMLCDWSQYRSIWSRIEDQTRRGALPCSPIIFLNGSDDVALAHKLALAYTRVFVPDLAMEPFVTKPRQSSKLRIGYFSNDYREHPVATLIVGVLEQHDRDQFEIFGYALNKSDGGAMRKRMQQAFDQFIDISELADEKVVNLVREHQLDIAIDLNGYTEGCRPAIFRSRIAPVQLSYLGFPGTSGASHFDYTVADHHIIPQASRQFYSEQLLYMPDCFQPNDDSRTLSTDTLSRAQFGLPEEAVVFCCFNKLYKLNPEVFTCWMQILQQVPASVLWLYTEDEVARQNLRREAAKAGVSSERLVFAGRTEVYSHHLARYRLADLFLDTFPYTAHTTASDAMWAGLPVLTRSGQSLASRVGESLLMTLGMQELVTRSISEFVAKAVELANEGGQGSRQGFDRLKQTLDRARKASSLYDTKQYARWLEKGYRMVHERSEQGLLPQTASISR